MGWTRATLGLFTCLSCDVAHRAPEESECSASKQAKEATVKTKATWGFHFARLLLLFLVLFLKNLLIFNQWAFMRCWNFNFEQFANSHSKLENSWLWLDLPSSKYRLGKIQLDDSNLNLLLLVNVDPFISKI